MASLCYNSELCATQRGSGSWLSLRPFGEAANPDQTSSMARKAQEGSWKDRRSTPVLVLDPKFGRLLSPDGTAESSVLQEQLTKGGTLRPRVCSCQGCLLTQINFCIFRVSRPCSILSLPSFGG